MYEDTYMYAIERNPEYLAHYGIRGMKWGVRKAREMGGARGARRLGRQYAKAQKKLAKLEKQAGKSKKYARRAALMGAGAAAAGGLAALGTGGAGRLVARAGDTAANASHAIGKAMINLPGRGKVAQRLHRAGSAMMTAGGVGKGRGAIRRAGGEARRAIEQWGKSTSISTGLGKAAIDATGKTRNAAASAIRRNAVNLHNSGISNNTIARVGAGVLGAGLAAGAARNAYKAATAQKKAARFKSEMNKAFAGTKYANGGNRQGKKRRRSNKA